MKTWIGIGIAAGAAALLYYPSLKLFGYLAKRRANGEQEKPQHLVKAFVPAYRGKHNPHHRHEQEGRQQG